VDPNDLEIRGINVPNYALDPASFRYDAATRTATWRLADGQFFNNDRILLDLNGEGATGVRDLDNNLLDGEWNNPSGASNQGDTYPSGNGSPGGDFRFRLNVIAGDTERDGIVLARDYSEVKKRFFNSVDNETAGSPTPYTIFHDVDGSGVILATDYAEVKKRFFNRLPAGEPT
jgi:hypothetical protein